MKRLLAILLIMTLALPVYAKKHQSEEIITPQTQLEKRKFQTRTYQAKDSTKVLKAVLNVLQDEGYLVYNVNSLLGYVYAVKDFDTTDPNIDISKEFGLSKSRLNYNGIKVATIETSANVTQYGDILRVRINFKRKLLNEYGNAQFIDDVSESEFYDDFYKKLNTALAIHDEINNAEEKQETEVNSTKAAEEPVIGPELMKEINDEINKIINSETTAIPEVSVSEPVDTEKTPETESQQPAEVQEEETQTPEVKEEVKEEEIKPAKEESEVKPEEAGKEETEAKPEEAAKEQQKEEKKEVTSETNTENCENTEEKEEVTENRTSKKEKKAKNKKNKNSKENITEETPSEEKTEEITEE